MATLDALAVRVLRKLTIGATGPTSSAQSGTATVSAVAAAALRRFGIFVADEVRPASATIVSKAEIAARALRAVGANPGTFTPGAGSGATYTLAELAAQGLLQAGITVPPADQPVPGAVITYQEIAARALRALGVNPAVITGGIGTGTTYTAAALATEVLRKLAIVDSTETPVAADQATALARVNDVHDTLVATDFVTWAAGSIPSAAAEYYIIMAAQLLGPYFGKPGASAEVFALAREQIRVLALSGVNGQAIAEARVRSVHEELNTLGLVSWSEATIPPGHANLYTQMMVSRLFPAYKPETADDRKLNAGLIQEGIAQLREAGRIRGVIAGAAGQAAAIHDRLVSMGFVSWGSNLIPSDVIDAMTDLMAGQVNQVMGRDGAGKDIEAAEGRIRQIALSGAMGQALADAKVTAIHEELVRLGLASWTDGAIPAAYSEGYVRLAATLLGPVYQGPAAQAAATEAHVAALEDVRRVVRASTAQPRAIQAARGVHESLVATDYVTWTAETIPPGAFESYVEMTVQKLSPDFAAPYPPEMALMARAMARRQALAGTAGQEMAKTKLRVTHYNMESQGLTRWSLMDIPDYAEESYVMMAASLLGPDIGEKFDPNWWRAGEIAIRRAIMVTALDRPLAVDYF